MNSLIYFYLSEKENKRIKLIPQNVDKRKLLKIEEAIAILSKGVPIQYITKIAKFYNRDFYIQEGIFIPRLDTEYLIDIVLEKIKDINKPLECLDICTGCGVVPITLILENPKIRAVCTDINKKALKIAFYNSYKFNVADKLEIVFSNVFDELTESYYNRFDFITANPPYVPPSRYKKLHCSIFYEPKNAIVAKNNGMEIIEKMLCGYKKYLKKNGFFIFEFPIYNIKSVKKLFKRLRIVNFKFYYENNTGFVCIENGS